MANNKKEVDYRALKKGLAKYFKFSFRAPREGKDFKPQQKAAITRKLEKIAPYINADFTPKIQAISFIEYPKHSKLPNIDGVRTDTGLFYKWPNATLKKSKVEKNKNLIVVDPTIKKGGVTSQQRRDIFIPFPKSILTNPQKIAAFVEKIRAKYLPHGIQWSLEKQRSRSIFDIEKLNLYIATDVAQDNFDDAREYVEMAIKRYKNIFSDDVKKRAAVHNKILKSEWYNFLDDIEKDDFWAGLNYQRSVRTDGVYNGVFLVYYL